ncbi:MAG TPA: SIS domain-containing protein, partial [Candidatus Bathyarchaeia archaeon]|nr:SIS domain-containing protein [Candidatus Bathyarchaeia archaeon]
MAKPKVTPEQILGSKAIVRKPSTGMKWEESLALNSIRKSIETKERLSKECLSQIIQMAYIMVGALRQGRKVAFFGNGGSAADAQ